ncbi:hypothetical protein OTU49_002015 [Cherax quadricarinatus]|uniref:Fibronectin type-III domain-containing protein n=1 Tax=Cherax quadricarinatus TaxID=27406 RepID=A0AAW0XVD4_CHEQU
MIILALWSVLLLTAASTLTTAQVELQDGDYEEAFLDLSLSSTVDSITANWQDVSEATNYTISWTSQDIEGDDSVDGSRITYQITDLDQCTVYTVTVEALNETDKVLSSATSAKATKAPMELSLSEGSRDIKVTWKAVMNATSYNVSWIPEDDNRTFVVLEDTSYHITELLPCTTYAVTVQPMNDTGGLPCAETKKRNTKAEDSSAVIDLMVDADTTQSTVLHVSWTPPQKPGNCRVYYKISWILGNNTQSVEQRDIDHYNITGLKPCTTYEVEVETRTSDKYSVKSRQNATTGIESATSFTYKDLKSKKVTLTWTPPSVVCSGSSYQLSYDDMVMTLHSDVQEYQVKSLKARTSYTFNLKIKRQQTWAW